MNKAAMNIVELVSLWSGGAAFVHMPGVLQLGLQVELLTIFETPAADRFLKRLHKFALPPSMEKCSAHSMSPAAGVSLEVLILAILTGVRWNFRVVLTCMSLMTKDLEPFFKCFSSVEISLFRYPIKLITPLN